MTTDEKIDLLITRLIEKSPKFYWSQTSDGWSIVVSPETGYRIHVNRDTMIHVLTTFGDCLIPPEDLNPPRNIVLRTKLVSTVSKLWQDRSELIDDLLSQLKNL